MKAGDCKSLKIKKCRGKTSHILAQNSKKWPKIAQKLQAPFGFVVSTKNGFHFKCAKF